MRRLLSVRTAIFVIALVLVVLGVFLMLASQSAPELESPMLPDDQPTILVSATPSTSVSPSSSSKIPESVAPEPIQDPRGNPTRVVIRSAKTGKRLVDTKMTPIHVQSDGRLVPPSGMAGWLADDGWPKPGLQSLYRSIVAGHVSGGGNPDVFYDLPKVRKGDTATVTFSSGDVAVIEITVDPMNVGKDDVTTKAKYDWVWEGKKPGRVVSFFTCNLAAEHIGGHSVENWVTQGRVIEVIRKE